MNSKFSNLIKSNFQESLNLKSEILNSKLIEQITNASLSIVEKLSNGGKIFFAGNGGSFSNSNHLATEFISRFMIDRNGLPAIALGSSGSTMSAISNDYDFKNVFSRELKSLSCNKDIFFPISTSGNSINIINAVKTANSNGLKVIALTGSTGGALNELCECIKVPSTNVARIQECHILIGHSLCQIVEESLFRK